MSQRVELCSATEVAHGNALKVETGNLSLAVFNVDGEYYVMDDLCSHGPGSLSEGYIDGDVVECNFHNGQFNIKTGEVVAPPCMVPMKTYKTVVEDGRVMIETASQWLWMMRCHSIITGHGVSKTRVNGLVSRPSMS